jgi:hypothetical protein
MFPAERILKGSDLFQTLTISYHVIDTLIEEFQKIPQYYDVASVRGDIAVARDIVFDGKLQDTIENPNLVWNIRLAHVREKADPKHVSRKKDLVFWQIDDDVSGSMGMPIIEQFKSFPSKMQLKFMVESDMGQGHGDGFLLKDFFDVRFPV